jgi:ADP-heptose:LPS heptosyltransferase
MRKIDYWVGVPLCFVLTILTKLAGPGRPKTPARNVLFIELSEMGTAILADPAMRKARDKLGAELFFLIFRKNAASLDFLRTVPLENVCTIRDDNVFRLAADTLRYLVWARRRRIDTVIDLELFSRFTALLTGLSGAARRVGFYRFHNEGLYRGELLTHRIAYNPHIHMAKNLIAMVNALLSPSDEVPFSKTLIEDDEVRIAKAVVTAADIEAMRARVNNVAPGYRAAGHRIVLLNSNGSDLLPQRRWPQGHFAEIARQIVAEWPDVLVLLTGSPQERDQAETLREEAAHERVFNFAGQVKLRELAALYSISTLMVTNDSGPGHFSSVTDLRTIVLFGPETPALYRSLGNSEAITSNLACSPCVSAANHRKSACSDPVCMQVLSPDRVMRSVRSALAPG